MSIGITLKLIRYWKASIRCALWKLVFIAMDCRSRWITLGHSFFAVFCSSACMHQKCETRDSLAMWWSSGKFVLTYRISETMYVAWIRMIFLTFHLAVSIYIYIYIYIYAYISLIKILKIWLEPWKRDFGNQRPNYLTYVEQREIYFGCSLCVKKNMVTRETQMYVKNRANLIYAKFVSIISVSKPTEEFVPIGLVLTDYSGATLAYVSTWYILLCWKIFGPLERSALRNVAITQKKCLI